MKENIKEQLEAAIAFCARRAVNSASSIEALQYTQAALNAANTIERIVVTEPAK